MAIKAETSFSLADDLFNADSVGELAKAVKTAWPAFRDRKYKKDALARFPDLALKERIAWLVELLGQHLPEDFDEAVSILRHALPPPLDPTLSDDDFGKFIWVVPGEYIAAHGVTKNRLEPSLAFLREATLRFSSENAIRPFINAFPDATLDFVHRLADDDNYHARRLASEGIRPLLPWSPRITLDVDDILPVLDKLYADPTRYVVRSVANNLNDISRGNPDRVISTLRRWQTSDVEDPEERTWLTRHALRTLLKQDHVDAFELLGYTPTPAFRVSHIEASETVTIGDAFEYRAKLTSTGQQKLRIMLAIHYLTANGKQSPKLFLVKDGEFEKGETLEITKRQPLRPMTTRVLYPGSHFAELIVNGVRRGKRAFELCAP